MMADANLQKQIFESFNRANRILIPLGPHPSGDSLASALALAEFLRRLRKEPWVVTAGTVHERFRFLPGASQVQNAIQQSRGFIIAVRTQNAPLDELSYHLDEQASLVNIYLRPKSGQYQSSDVSFRSDKFPYDLIVSLDIPSLDQLGELYDRNTDLFFETPIINIDHHSNNEHFGEINLVEVTATSTAEILMELLESFEAGLIDGDIATNLLAGILVETNSFQNNRTTPKAFLRASSLISLGANQQDIVKNLYKTKSIGLLKLWGRALARLKESPELGLSYSILKSDDLVKAGSMDIAEVMDELVISLSDSRIVILLAETAPGEIQGYLYTHPSLSSLEVENLFSAQQQKENVSHFIMTGRSVVEAETDVLDRLHKIKDKIMS